MCWKRFLAPPTVRWFILTAIFWFLAAVIPIAGCTPRQKVLVPPRIDLASYNTIGIVEFTSNSDAWLKPHVTQNFMQRIHAAQPGVKFLELGNIESLLQSIGADRLDPASVKAISRKYQVNSIFIGHLDVFYVKPEIRWNPAANTAKAEAYLEGSLTARLMEGQSGATLWTLASTAKKPFGAIKMHKTGPPGLKVNDPDSVYRRLVHALVDESTRDFYPYYVYHSTRM